MSNEIFIVFIFLYFSQSFSFMPVDTAGRWCRITREHQMIPEYDTVLVTHYRQHGKGFYVMLKNGQAIIVDDCFEIDTAKER